MRRLRRHDQPESAENASAAAAKLHAVPDERVATQTDPLEHPLPRLKRARLARRIIVGALCVFLAAAAFGAFGVRTRSVSSTAADYELTVEYATVTRPGLATPWAIEVVRPAGFEGPITLAASSAYLDMFDENGLDPDPSKATADGDFVHWEFDPPPGDTLSVSFDARIEPARQWGRSGVVKLIVDDRVLTQVTFRTWVMP